MEAKDKEENTLTIETYISWKDKRFALKDFIKETLKEIEDNKKRIDKAIEYIENLQQSNEELQRDYNKSIDFGIYETDNLLSILKGDTNE